MKLVITVLINFISISALALPELGQKIMVSSASREASEAGVEIAKLGGNAIDVTIATALALSVTRPYYAALGGGGFALVKDKDKIEALDFREVAPQATAQDYYTKENRSSVDGGTAVGVPGIPMGLWELHKKYGKLHWSQLFGPAIRLATKGFQITGEWANITSHNKKRFNKAGLGTFFRKDAVDYEPGDILVQKNLGRFLKEFQTRGIVAFYSGMAARDIINAVKSTQGDMSLKDLSDYKVRWFEPLKTRFDAYDIYLMPPPSSGGVVIASALDLTTRLNLQKYNPLSIEEFHLMSEILSRSFRGRSLLGDPDFHKNPINELLSEKYLKKLASSISTNKATTLKPMDETHLKDEFETTNISVMNQDGSGVAMTITLNGGYGSAVVTEKFGIALNNEMDDFTTRPNEPNMFGLIQGKGNLVEPGKRPLSSMSPTLVMQDKELKSVIGSPGGPRIISAVYQVLYRTLINKWDMDHAIQAARVHHQFLPNKVYTESDRLSPNVIEGLRKKGHEVEDKTSVAKVYGVQRNKEGYLEGAADNRGDGAAVGY